MQTFSFDFFWSLLLKLIPYTIIVLEMTLFATIIALILAVILALVTYKKTPVISQIFAVFISFFRGTPLIAQLFLIYFGLPQIFPFLTSITAMWIAIFVIGVNASAYMAVSIRGAIEAVDIGQHEACKSVGMSSFQAMFRVILPQAAIIAIPNLTNISIDILKSTAQAFTIGVLEVMGKAQILGNNAGRFFEAYAASIIIYWILNIILSRLQALLAKSISKAY